MISAWCFLAGLAVSSAGLAMLTYFNRKRRRAHRITEIPLPVALRLALWIGVLTPGAWYLAIGHFSAFTNWLGAVTVVGWLLAFLLPLALGERSEGAS